MAIVLDASTTLAWLFRDEPSAHADRVLDRLAHEPALVPSIWPLEVSNGILMAERAGRIAADEVDKLRDDVHALSVTVSEVPIELALGPIVELARAHGLTSYDASYLELAFRERIPLATQDADLRAAAERVGVAIVS